MRTLSTYLLFLITALAVSAGEAESLRIEIKDLIQSDATVEIRPPEEYEFPRGEKATTHMRMQKIRVEWSEFLRTKTIEKKNSAEQRSISADVFWKNFFGTMSPDLAILAANRTGYINRLGSMLKNKRQRAELDATPAIRAKMTQRIDRALADIDMWKKKDAQSNSARSRMAQSIPALIAPLE